MCLKLKHFIKEGHWNVVTMEGYKTSLVSVSKQRTITWLLLHWKYAPYCLVYQMVLGTSILLLSYELRHRAVRFKVSIYCPAKVTKPKTQNKMNTSWILPLNTNTLFFWVGKHLLGSAMLLEMTRIVQLRSHNVFIKIWFGDSIYMHKGFKRKSWKQLWKQVWCDRCREDRICSQCLQETQQLPLMFQGMLTVVLRDLFRYWIADKEAESAS